MVEVCLELDFIFNYTKFYLYHLMPLMLNSDIQLEKRKLYSQRDMIFRT